MFTTNLLPPEEKKIIRLEEIRRTLLFFAVSLAGIFSLGSVLLLPSFIPIVVEKRNLERAYNIEEEAVQKLMIRDTLTKVRTVKINLVSLREFLSTPPKSSTIFNRFTAGTGEGITLAGMTVKKNGDFSMRGTARTRRDLLRFEQGLRDSGWFQELSFPLSNIVRETDISFVFQGKLKSQHGL